VSEDGSIGPDLVRWGRAARIETTGRRTGRPNVAFISFHAEADGSLLVAAASANASWAQNLQAEPAASVTIEDRTFAVLAEPLEGAEYANAIRELILKGGTPAERLGHGPGFRLRRVIHADVRDG
jgi:deazaflavin-dependent oxidoreductase (nitroreductase family)